MAKFRFDWKGQMPPEIRKFSEYLSNPLALGFWGKLDAWMSGIVGRMFRQRGGEYGRDRWPDISPTMYGKLRRGTDGQYYGRYSPESEPLIASGNYLRSFGMVTVPRATRMVWGSRWGEGSLASMIPHAGRGNRFALPDDTSQQYLSELSEHVEESFIREAMRRARQ